MMNTKNVVNLTTFNKNPLPRWIDINHARFQLEQGCSIYQFASDDNPDIVVAAVGDIPTTEMLAAIKIAKERVPTLRIRFVGIAALSYGAIGTTTSKLRPHDFDDYFTIDKPIIVNFHGYAETMRGIMSHYTNPQRVTIHGYRDEGSTTSPLDELARNFASRYHLAADILERAGHYDFDHELRDKVIQNAQHASLTGLDEELI
jgi:xylulose-5-phosphate/fructose-6-phosphate phosphoketolase